jgi:membrane-associated phospholipid phosphatase
MSQKKITKKIQEKVSKPLTTVPRRTFGRRRFLFNMFLVGLIIALAILTFFAKKNPYFPFDLSITLAIQSFHPQWFDWLMNFITLLGYFYEVIFLVLAAALFLWIKKRPKDAIFIIISTLGAEGIGELVKTYVGRVRPNPGLVHQFTKYIRNDSFPSGHVLFYIGLFGYLLFLVYSAMPKSPLKIVLMILFSILILLVGPSRIYLGAHWFSDVLGAYLIGFLWLVLVIVAHSKLQLKIFKTEGGNTDKNNP